MHFMRTKLIILILQTLKHFNDVLNSLYLMSYSYRSYYDKDYKDINKKLTKEIEYQKGGLVKRKIK